MCECGGYERVGDGCVLYERGEGMSVRGVREGNECEGCEKGENE